MKNLNVIWMMAVVFVMSTASVLGQSEAKKIKLLLTARWQKLNLLKPMLL